MATRIQLRRGTAAQWTTANPTLAEGEIGTELDTGMWKTGNGASNWATLDYSTGPQGDEGDKGEEGLSVWTTADQLSTGSTTGVATNAVTGRTRQIGDLVISNHASSPGVYGRITAVTGATSTVAYVGSVRGVRGGIWHSGAAGPTAGDVQEGDMWLRSSGTPIGEVQRRTGGAWVAGGNIRGPEGPGGVPLGGQTDQVLGKDSNVDQVASWRSSGVPRGGDTNQILGKIGTGDWALSWRNGLPAGGATGTALRKTSGTDFATEWQEPMVWRDITTAAPIVLPSGAYNGQLLATRIGGALITHGSVISAPTWLFRWQTNRWEFVGGPPYRLRGTQGGTNPAGTGTPELMNLATRLPFGMSFLCNFGITRFSSAYNASGAGMNDISWAMRVSTVAEASFVPSAISTGTDVMTVFLSALGVATGAGTGYSGPITSCGYNWSGTTGNWVGFYTQAPVGTRSAYRQGHWFEIIPITAQPNVTLTPWN